MTLREHIFEDAAAGGRASRRRQRRVFVEAMAVHDITQRLRGDEFTPLHNAAHWLGEDRMNPAATLYAIDLVKFQRDAWIDSYQFARKENRIRHYTELLVWLKVYYRRQRASIKAQQRMNGFQKGLALRLMWATQKSRRTLGMKSGYQLPAHFSPHRRRRMFDPVTSDLQWYLEIAKMNSGLAHQGFGNRLGKMTFWERQLAESIRDEMNSLIEADDRRKT